MICVSVAARRVVLAVPIVGVPCVQVQLADVGRLKKAGGLPLKGHGLQRAIVGGIECWLRNLQCMRIPADRLPIKCADRV
eukprot:7771823-Pyramimonas_sp.AAC.1